MGRHSAAAPPQRPAGVVVVVALVLGLILAGGLYYLLRRDWTLVLRGLLSLLGLALLTAAALGPGACADYVRRVMHAISKEDYWQEFVLVREGLKATGTTVNV